VRGLRTRVHVDWRLALGRRQLLDISSNDGYVVTPELTHVCEAYPPWFRWEVGMVLLPVLAASAVVFAIAVFLGGGQTPPPQHEGGPGHPAATAPGLAALHERAKAARSDDSVG
jgi:hypothetical protein